MKFNTAHLHDCETKPPILQTRLNFIQKLNREIMSNSIDNQNIDQAEAFQMEYGWFISHVISLSMTPLACCEDQGHYNVAHELWYFFSDSALLPFDAQITRLSAEQHSAMTSLCQTVQTIPEEARVWTTVAQESLANMSHPAWQPARMQAQQLLVLLENFKPYANRLM